MRVAARRRAVATSVADPAGGLKASVVTSTPFALLKQPEVRPVADQHEVGHVEEQARVHDAGAGPDVPVGGRRLGRRQPADVKLAGADALAEQANERFRRPARPEADGRPVRDQVDGPFVDRHGRPSMVSPLAPQSAQIASNWWTLVAALNSE